MTLAHFLCEQSCFTVAARNFHSVRDHRDKSSQLRICENLPPGTKRNISLPCCRLCQTPLRTSAADVTAALNCAFTGHCVCVCVLRS